MKRGYDSIVDSNMRGTNVVTGVASMFQLAGVGGASTIVFQVCLCSNILALLEVRIRTTDTSTDKTSRKAWLSFIASRRSL
jgi:hypothetical protein